MVIKMLPREKLIKYGVSSLEEYELLSIILGVGTNDENVFELSQRILNNLDSIKSLLDLSYEELIKIKGIKSAKATKIIASIELAKRIFQYQPEKIKLDNPKEIFSLLQYEFLDKNQEYLVVLYLDKNIRLKKKNLISIGGDDFVAVDVKEILRQAIRVASSNIVLVHNHPSGSLKPSEADIIATKKIICSANLCDVNVLDHIIIAGNKYFSFLEKGLINNIMKEF